MKKSSPASSPPSKTKSSQGLSAETRPAPRAGRAAKVGNTYKIALQKRGGSQGLILPAEVLDFYHLRGATGLSATMLEEGLLLKADRVAPRYTLSGLIRLAEEAGVEKIRALSAPFDDLKPSGKEVW